MSTDNMPNTNQGSDYRTLADKIPPTIADGFEQAAEMGANKVIQQITSGMSQGGQ